MIDWIAYGYAQRTEKNPETFGTGDVRGVIAPESSNNAKEGGHLVPTIAFGVPAGASMAILLGAFLMHGLTPGPEMLTKQLDVTYTIVWSLTLAHVDRRDDLPGVLPVPCPHLDGAAGNSAADRAVAGVRRGLRGLARLGRPVLADDLRRRRLDHEAARLAAAAAWCSASSSAAFSSAISTSRTRSMGWAWLGRPVVMAILVLVAWALYRPLSEIVKSVVCRAASRRLASAAVFGLGGVYHRDHRFHPHGDRAVVRLAGGREAGAAHRVLHGADRRDASTSSTSCSARSRPRAATSTAASTSAAVTSRGDRYYGMSAGAMRTRAAVYFLWLVGLMALVALIGFIPAIAVFVFAYMHYGFGERALPSAVFAAATTLLCWGLFHKLLAVAWPQSLLGDYFPALRASLGFI